MGFAVAIIVAAAAGFIALSYEILWYRVISYASWGLPGAFGLLLAAYLFGLAIGSRVAGNFCKDKEAEGDRSTLRKLAMFTFFANVVAWLVVPFFGLSSKLKIDWVPALAAVALAAALLGAILPLVAHFGIKPDDKAGQKLSYVYLSNIIGSSAGSLITGFVFLDVMKLQQIGALVACLGMVLVAALMFLSDAKGVQRASGLVIPAVAALVFVQATPKAYDRIWERLQYKSAFDEETTRFRDVVETKSGVIAVTQQGFVYGGGAYDGKVSTSIRGDVNGIFRAYGVGAMHPDPKQVLMIGLATGAWAQVVGSMDKVEHMSVVEINPGYLELIAKYDEVKSLLHNPKVDIQIDDGRRWLNRHPDRKFDFIVMNTTWNWRAHSTNLLSVEFLNLARAHLNKGGILYYNSTSSEDVKYTAAKTFAYSLRVWNFVAVSDEPFTWDKTRWIDLLKTMKIDGKKVANTYPDDEDDRQWWAEQAAFPDTVNGPPDEEGLEAGPSIIARAEKADPPAGMITDDNMLPEWRKVIRFQDPPH